MLGGTVCSVCLERTSPEAEAFLDTCFHTFCVEVSAAFAQLRQLLLLQSSALWQGQCKQTCFLLAVTLVSCHSPSRASVHQS